MKIRKGYSDILSLTWPIYIESFLRMLLGNVNIFMLSKFSDQAVGAVGVSNQLINMLYVMYGIVSLGTAITVSQYVGAGQLKMASKVANVSLAINLIFGLVASILLIIVAPFILSMMNLTPQIQELGYQYLSIVGGMSFTQALMSAMSAISRSYGYTQFPMFVAFGVNISNVIGNYICIFQPFGLPVLGVRGVAVSLILSQTLGVIMLAAVLKRNIGIHFSFKNFRPFPTDILKGILKIGTPAAGESIAYTLSQIATTYIVASFGAYAITGIVYVQNITNFVGTISYSIGQGTQILIGHLVGAGKMKEAYDTGFRNSRLALIVGSVVSLTVILFRFQLLSLFTNDEKIINAVSMLFIINMFIEMARSFNHSLGNGLRASGDVRFPMMVAIISMWGISVSLCYILGSKLNMALMGIWIAYAVDESVRATIFIKRWKSKVWQNKRIVVDN